MTSWAELSARTNEAGFRAFGSPAFYTPPGAASQPVRAILINPTGALRSGQFNLVSTSEPQIEIRKSEIPSPAEGAQIAFPETGETFVIRGAPETSQDDRSIWSLKVKQT